jgi:hypothetical protein
MQTDTESKDLVLKLWVGLCQMDRAAPYPLPPTHARVQNQEAEWLSLHAREYGTGYNSVRSPRKIGRTRFPDRGTSR